MCGVYWHLGYKPLWHEERRLATKLHLLLQHREVTIMEEDEIGKIDDPEADARRKKGVLRDLLDEKLAASSHFMATKVYMGDMASYLTSASLKWIASNVKYATDLPAFEGKRDPTTGKIIMDTSTIDELSQRQPDWRRQIPMVRYLAMKQHHKFPPILVVSSPPWVDDPNASQWLDGVAAENSISVAPLDSNGKIVELDYKNTTFYALDGQHRLMAIQGFRDLLNERRIAGKNQYGVPYARRELNLDTLLSELPNGSFARMQSLLNESLGIEIIPAVLKGETKQSAMQRLRSIFVHINKHAKTIPKGELALLNEEDGFSILARKAMVTHPLLASRVDCKMANLAATSAEYTTLESLKTMARNYLCYHTDYLHWFPSRANELPQRPSEEELDTGLTTFMNFIDGLVRLPSHNMLMSDISVSAADFRKKDNQENIFFRPNAQMALARALGYLEFNQNASLDKIMDTLARRENNGELRLREPDSIWFGVLCTMDGHVRRQKKSRKLCALLLMHLLGGELPIEIKRDMLYQYRQAKIIDRDRGIYMDATGQACNERLKILLPDPWM